MNKKLKLLSKNGRVDKARFCRKLLVLSMTSTMALGGVASFADVDKIKLNIAAQSTDMALLQLAEDSGVHIIFAPEIASQSRSPSIQGVLTVSAALDRMLGGSNLVYEIGEDNVVLIKEKANNVKTDRAERVEIEEIIVTANKRGAGMSIQDTAMSVSAMSSDTINKRNLVGMEDYLQSLPSVSVQDRGATRNNITIRGVASDQQIEASAVGVYFGETPVTDLRSGSLGGAAGSLDVKLVDIERVEILRGPQGTLYGSGSMAGTVRLIPKSPNLEEFEGELSAGYSFTGGAGSDNSRLQGVINVPLMEDTLAFRGVVYRFDNSGYVSNVAASQGASISSAAAAISASGIARDRGDIGADQYTGFRGTLLWQPTEQLGVKVSYLDQEIEQDGAPEVNLNLDGNYQQARIGVGINGVNDERLVNDVNIMNLEINYDLGWGSLVSSTSDVSYHALGDSDASGLLFAPYQTRSTVDIDHFSQEIRFTSKFDGPLQVLAGLYYEDKDDLYGFGLFWTGDPLQDTGFTLNVPTLNVVEQKAFFTELSYELSDSVAVSVGARSFEYDRSLIGTFDSTVTERAINHKGQTYKVNLSYKPTEDSHLYAQWAEGFRLGVPQRVFLPSCDANNDGILDGVGIPIPSGTDPDNLENFEIGYKSSWADNRVSLNAAIYRINWEGIPVTLIPACGTGFGLNAGKSKSEGVEVEAHFLVTDTLKVNLTTSYGKAELTEDVVIVPSFGSDGDSLPGSPDFNLNIGIEKYFTIGSYEAFVRSDFAYIGEYYSNISEIGQPAGGYGIINGKFGIAFNDFDIDLFVKNLTNQDDLTWVEAVLGGDRAYRMRPRTVGVNFNYHF